MFNGRARGDAIDCPLDFWCRCPLSAFLPLAFCGLGLGLVFFCLLFDRLVVAAERCPAAAGLAAAAACTAKAVTWASRCNAAASA
jgi:hypothetical protein